MSKTKKLIAVILIAFAAVFLLWLVYSTASSFAIRELKYESMAFGVVIAEYKIDFTNGTAERNYYDFDGSVTAHKEVILSAGQQRSLHIVCARSGIRTWGDKYINHHILDGDQWRTVLTFDGYEKSTYGSNAYPTGYYIFHDAIKSVFE